MKRKLGLIQAFQADPLLLILDEPTEGLDPLMQESFYELLADARNRGRTVFMSSHVLPEVERVCDRIAMLRKGEVVLLSSVEDARKLASRRVRVAFQQDVAVPASLPQGYEMIDAKPRAWILRVTGQLGSLPSFLAALPVADLAVEEARLEDVLVSTTGMAPNDHALRADRSVASPRPQISPRGRRVAGGVSGCPDPPGQFDSSFQFVRENGRPGPCVRARCIGTLVCRHV